MVISVCEAMNLEVKEGLPGVKGAKYRMHASFKEGAGTLFPNINRTTVIEVFYTSVLASH